MGRRGILLVAALGATALIAWPSSATSQDPSPKESATAKQAELQSDQDSAAASKPKPEPDVVKVGGLINDIQQLDLQSHSYTVDMYIWFKWKNPDLQPALTMEFLNPFELWGHIKSYEYNPPEQLPDGSYYQVVHNQGKFNTKLPLEKYPFDSQHLQVVLEDSSADATQVVYEPDTDPVAISKDLVIPGWEIGEPTLEVIDNRYDSSFGDTRYEDVTYSRAIFDLPVARPEGTYALKLLLPLLLVALTAALALLVHPRFVEGRIGIGITALLTLVALQITSNSSLPEVDYLILLDKIYIASYAFVVLTMVAIVKNSWVDAEEDVAVATVVDRRSLLWLMVTYFVVILVLFLTSLL